MCGSFRRQLQVRGGSSICSGTRVSPATCPSEFHQNPQCQSDGLSESSARFRVARRFADLQPTKSQPRQPGRSVCRYANRRSRGRATPPPGAPTIHCSDSAGRSRSADDRSRTYRRFPSHRGIPLEPPVTPPPHGRRAVRSVRGSSAPNPHRECSRRGRLG